MAPNNTREDSIVSPPNPSGLYVSPSRDGETYLEPILHRRSHRNGWFVRLRPEDRQLYFAFYAERN